MSTTKVNLRLGQLTFQLEGTTQKELFKTIAAIQEVFSEEACGLCGCETLRFVVREVDGNDYAEIHCTNAACRAKLAFGQSKQKPGTLFPIRKLTKEGKPHRKTGEFGKHNGWTKYRGDSPASDE